MTTTPRVGDLRPSQLLHTFGVGAVVDLPELSAVVCGLDDWPEQQCPMVSESRLLAAVRDRLGAQVETLRSPPPLPDDVRPGQAVPGAPVSPFPRWLRCPACRLLSSVDHGLFTLQESPWRPDRTHFQHADCPRSRRAPHVLPARFLLACPSGHLDDFPWLWFVHRGADCSRSTLELRELGTGGTAADVEVACRTCGARRRMVEAFGQDASLPPCRGRHPHLGMYEACPSPDEQRTILRGASNSWFGATLSALTIPDPGGELDQLLDERWALIENMPGAAALSFALTLPDFVALHDFAKAHGLSEHDLWSAIEQRRAGGDDDGQEDLRLAEWRVFSEPERAGASDDFRLRVADVPSAYEPVLAEVVRVERLREVVALTGFTRIQAPGDAAAGEDVPVADLARMPPRWVPCTEVRGEGLFLRFREDAMRTWEERFDAGGRAEQLAGGLAEWRRVRGLDPGSGWRSSRYVLLHSLSHLLLREVALECGYGAASIRERLYATPPGGPDMAGILLYTAAPDSEGTLGGLVSLSDRVGVLLDQALERAGLCSADPLCSERRPWEESLAHGAACHACLFAAETSCEAANRHLDRATVVDTFAGATAPFFAGGRPAR